MLPAAQTPAAALRGEGGKDGCNGCGRKGVEGLGRSFDTQESSGGHKHAGIIKESLRELSGTRAERFCSTGSPATW